MPFEEHEDDRYGLRAGDMVVCEGGEAGRAAIWDGRIPNMKFQKAIHRVRPGSELDARFLLHQLRYDYEAGRLADYYTGATIKHLTGQDLARYRFSLPPLAEQWRIAAILDKADALRTKRRAALAQLDTLTQSIFLDMFGDPIANPKGFEVKPLIDLIESSRPISYGILMPGPYVESGVKYIRVVDMKAGGIDVTSVRRTSHEISRAYRRSLLKEGDLLMSIRGHVGRFAVVPGELEGANITQDTARLAISGMSPVFVRECLRSPALQRWMVKHTKGVAVRGINLTDVKLMPIIVPAIDQQQSFTIAATTVDRTRSVEMAAAQHAEVLFASLQHRAFRGEL
jgi:type I restriction enzyme S subunit